MLSRQAPPKSVLLSLLIVVLVSVVLFNSMDCRSELVGGEQNGQTVQPTVQPIDADQNVKSLARKNKHKKYRAGKKEKIAATERQLKNMTAQYAELETAHAYSNEKADQSQKDMELLIEAYMLQQQTVIEQNSTIAEQATTIADQATTIAEQNAMIAEQNTRAAQQNATIERQNDMIYMLQPLLSAGTTGFDTGETGSPGVYQLIHNQFEATMESGAPILEESWPQSHPVEQAHWNTVEQPPLSDGGLTHGGDLLGSHDLYYTSSPRAAMASGSSPMQGPLAFGEQLPLGITLGNTSGTREVGPSVHQPPIYPSGTTIRPEGPTIEYPPELSQSHLPQGWPPGDNSEQPTSYTADQLPGVN